MPTEANAIPYIPPARSFVRSFSFTFASHLNVNVNTRVLVLLLRRWRCSLILTDVRKMYMYRQLVQCDSFYVRRRTRFADCIREKVIGECLSVMAGRAHMALVLL